MNPNEKIVSLQILRALASWSVVFHHYMQWFFNFQFSSPLGAFFTRYGAMGVDVFFVLSGFVVLLKAEKTRDSPTEFVIDRIFRIVPIFWFYCIVVVVCIKLFPDGFAYTSHNLKSLIGSFVFLPNFNPSGLGMYPVLVVGWTLNFEMFFYASLTLCMFLSRRYFFSILFIIFLALPLIYPANIFYVHIAGSTKLWEFLAGGVLAVAWRNPSISDFVAKRSTVSLVTMIVLNIISAMLYRIYGDKLSMATLIVLLALCTESYLNRSSRIIQWMVKLGNESYSTYLVHGIVLSIIIQRTGKNMPQIEQFFALVCYIIFVYLISKISYERIERNHYLEKLQRALNERVIKKNSRIPRSEKIAQK